MLSPPLLGDDGSPVVGRRAPVVRFLDQPSQRSSHPRVPGHLRYASPLIGSAVGLLLLVGCAPDLQGAADRTDAMARANAAKAEARLQELSTSSPAPEGEELLAAARQQVPDVRDASAVFRAELLDEDTVELAVAFDGRVQGNETGIYYSSRSRICVEMVVSTGDDAVVDVHDTPCDEDALASLGSDDVPVQVARTASLDD